MKYKIVDALSGEHGFIDAFSWDEAHQKAKHWLQSGEWGDQPTYVDYALFSLDEANEEVEEQDGRFAVNDNPEPDCASGMTHDWQTPYELLGGSIQNPGEWSTGNGRMSYDAVCANFGRYKRTLTASLNGQYPEVPEHSTYKDADEKSEAWLENGQD